MNSLKDRCIRFDWAIKRLLRQKANFDVLEGFLTVFLNEKVEIMEILESEGNQVSADDKPRGFQSQKLEGRDNHC